MIMTDQHMDTAGPRPTLSQVTGTRLVPSKETVRRVDPALSFDLRGADVAGFDVILASDPALFDPDQAHRRTPANFRSSKQDFGGERIDSATGFYMVPRAFLRDSLRQQPRPDRLYYVGVLYYSDAREPQMTIPHGAWLSAPFVGLAADIQVESLSKVLGVAVERLGVLDGYGRVSRPMSQQEIAPAPRSIGGLPLMPAQRHLPPRAATPQPPIQHVVTLSLIHI